MTISKDQAVSICINHLVDFQQPYLHVEYLFDSGNGKYDMVYCNKTMSTCTFLVKLAKSSVNCRNDVQYERFNIFSGQVHTNSPKNQMQIHFLQNLYYIKDMKMDTEYFPPIMLEEKWKVVFRYNYERSTRISQSWYVEVFHFE